MVLIIKFLLQALGLIAITRFVPGFNVENYTTALIVVVILALFNVLLRPILIVLTLPITIVTLGLFIFVINFVLFWFAVNILKGVSADSLSTLVIAWFLYSLLSTVINSLLQSSNV